MQQWTAEAEGFALGGFSTLYRVEGCAAVQNSGVTEFLIKFQYPLSGRRLCSTKERPPGAGGDTVSVPSIGSKAVQLSSSPSENGRSEVSVPSIGSKAVQQSVLNQEKEARQSFSTLYRVEGCAASGKPTPILLPSRFSTLYRVEGCAAHIHLLSDCPFCAFQCPLSGRRLCSRSGGCLAGC